MLAPRAEGRADFETWANRSTRVWEPSGYDVNGMAAHLMASWNGTRGMGNLGIGNGSIAALMAGSCTNESLCPANISAATVCVDELPPSITINQPYPNMCNEYPVEFGVLYGRMVGLKMPGCHNVNVGIKSLGYEY